MIDYGLVLATAPAEEPVSLAYARAWLKVEFDKDDAIIGELISAAREILEREFDRSLITQTWTMTTAGLPAWGLCLPRGPAQSVMSIEYVDPQGVTQTIPPEDYTLDTNVDPAILEPIYNVAWPSTRAQSRAVSVTYVAGYGTQAQIPRPIRQAILLAVAWTYSHRGDELQAGLSASGVLGTMLDLPPASRSLLRSYWNGVMV